MMNLLQTQSNAWAQGVRVALEAEGIPAAILDEHDRGGIGAFGRVRVVILNDYDLAKAQSILARLTPPRTPPPPSWRWQKRGLLLLGLAFVLFATWAVLLDQYQNDQEGSRLVLYALEVIVVLCFITGMLFIFLGPRADRTKGAP